MFVLTGERRRPKIVPLLQRRDQKMEARSLSSSGDAFCFLVSHWKNGFNYLPVYLASYWELDSIELNLCCCGEKKVFTACMHVCNSPFSVFDSSPPSLSLFTREQQLSVS